MSARQVEVQIMGQSYLLGCPEGGEVRLLEAVRRVDAAMCKIRDAGKIKARERIAVLAALNLAFDQPETATALPPDPASGMPPAGSSSSTDPDRLGALLERLDTALREDGRLL